MIHLRIKPKFVGFYPRLVGTINDRVWALIRSPVFHVMFELRGAMRLRNARDW
jgi:hypothetical protein